MRVLVTGAGGFLGRRAVARLLEEGHEVRAWLGPEDPPLHEVESLRGDICDLHAARSAVDSVEAVVHLAGPPSVQKSYQQAVEFTRVHVLGTAVLLDALRTRPGAILVHASSAEIYGRRRLAPVAPDAAPDPRSPYGAAKLGAEAMVGAFCRSHGLRAVALRIFSLYGRGLHEAALLSELVGQASDPGTTALLVSDPRPVRDFVHVDDVARCFCRSLDWKGHSGDLAIFNVGSGQGRSVREVAELVAAASGRNLEVRPRLQADRPPGAEIFGLVADIRATVGALRWQPCISLEDGIRELLLEVGGG